jgi:hypothetical protein
MKTNKTKHVTLKSNRRLLVKKKIRLIYLTNCSILKHFLIYDRKINISKQDLRISKNIKKKLRVSTIIKFDFIKPNLPLKKKNFLQWFVEFRDAECIFIINT